MSRFTLDRRDHQRQVVRLRGALTAASGEGLLDSLRTLSPVPTHVEIDLSGVTTIDRGGAALLLDAYVATRLRHQTFSLCGPSPSCTLSLRCSGVFDVVDLAEGGPVPERPHDV